MDTGFLIVILIVGLYVAFGPLIFLGLYIVFDRLAESEPTLLHTKKSVKQTDSALWSKGELEAFVKKRKLYLRCAKECL